MSAYSDAVLADSPLAYWRLDEASGNFADTSGNGHTAAAVGTPVYGQGGAKPAIGGSAVNFNGVSEGEIPAATFTSALTGFSVEAWVKFSSGSGNPMIVCFDDGIWRQAQFRSSNSAASAKAEFLAFVSGTAQPLDGATTIGNGLWHHVVGVYFNQASGATPNMFVYVDGVLDGSAVHNGTLDGTVGGQGSLYLGLGARRSGGAWSVNWPGSLDEVAVYGTALSAARVAAHYAAASPTAPPVINTRAALMRASTR